jgi:putative ABC transport system permease protein
MNLSFAVRHALRESRTTWRRIGLYMGAITLGVGALVAINAFRTNIVESIQHESRNLLGADLEFHSSTAFSSPMIGMFDSLTSAGTRISYVTSIPSMAYAPSTDYSRLVQVKALAGEFPYYGAIETNPAPAWRAFREARRVVVDPGVLVELGIAHGDTLLINEVPFEVAGTITTSPGEINLQNAIGPRVFIAADYLAETGLIRFGSLVRYQAYLEIPDADVLQNFLDTRREFFREQQVGWDTVAERVEDLTFAVGNMTRFLGLVGLTALLLGGVGVASAVHVFIKEKLDTVAVLRCLGATQRTVFAAYLLQAGTLGLIGALAGVTLGVAVQNLLPYILGDFIPLDVTIAVDWVVVLAGLFIGLWVATIFALLPLLAIWDVTPLRALRREYELLKRGDERRRRRWRYGTFGVLALSVLLLSMWQAPFPQSGAVFAGGIFVTTLLLYATARLLIRYTQKYFPRRARYVLRQGVANLFRPQNQTVAVTISLGFGVFLIATIYIVQRNILDRFDIDAAGERPNFAAFDIQVDQRDGVAAIFENAGVSADVTPIVPGQMSHLRGVSVEEIMADSARDVPRWALRREYRHTYRATISNSEEIIAGEWWEDAPLPEAPPRTPGTDRVVRISIEQELADDLQVGLGDRITWDFQGLLVESEITSVRTVDWARLDLNFFVVFEPRSLDDAPHTFITMARIDDATRRAEVQRDIVRAFPNVSVMDLGIIQAALDDIVGKITLAIRFMALFSIASGLLVLVGAISTSRFHRVRESVLLKTLGASRRQIGQIFSTEYATLGTLAGLTGITLAVVAGWLLIRFLFELEFRMPAGPLFVLWLGVAALTTAIGLASNRKVMRKPPLAVIREINE